MGGYNKIVVKSINMKPYGLTGTWTGPVTIGPSSAIKNTQYNSSSIFLLQYSSFCILLPLA